MILGKRQELIPASETLFEIRKSVERCQAGLVDCVTAEERVVARDGLIYSDLPVVLGGRLREPESVIVAWQIGDRIEGEERSDLGSNRDRSRRRYLWASRHR